MDGRRRTRARARNTQRGGRILREIIPYIIIFAVIILFRIFILINASVPTGSMEDTIPGQSRAMGLKCSYWFSEPQRGDIIVFYAPDEPDVAYVKRIIGIPGDTVEIRDNAVYLNGRKLDEPYLKEPMYDIDRGPYVVPDGSYFVLGDNRNDSKDARFWENTYVTSDAIMGKVYFTYWPRIRWIGDSAGDTFSGM